MYNYLDFEKPVADLEGKIIELKKLAENGEAVDVAEEIGRLEKRSREALREVYKALTPWQKVQVARHPDRPHCVNYIEKLITDFTPLAGDRAFGEDNAIIAGFGRFKGEPIALLGQEKGSDTKSRLKHNFGSPRPEGYRKAVRVMELADRFGIPMLTLVDTAGAYPGVDAEERGQAEAIARSTSACLGLKVPSVSVVIGEGRFGRGHRDCHRQPGLHVGARDLFGDLARRRGLDPVARHDALPRCRDVDEDHGAGPARHEDHRRYRAGADRWRAPVARRGDRGNRRSDRQGVFGFRRLQHRFPRASAREVPGDRPQPLKIGTAANA